MPKSRAASTICGPVTNTYDVRKAVAPTHYVPQKAAIKRSKSQSNHESGAQQGCFVVLLPVY